MHGTNHHGARVLYVRGLWAAQVKRRPLQICQAIENTGSVLNIEFLSADLLESCEETAELIVSRNVTEFAKVIENDSKVY